MHCKAFGIWWKLWDAYTKTSLYSCGMCWIILVDSSSKFVWILNFSRKPRFLAFKSYPENAFQNLSIIWGWSQKQKCRAWQVIQSLFSEFFKLFRKILSNLWILTNDQLVISVNSVHRLSYIAVRPSSAFQARRGCPWCRAGTETAPSWLPWASVPCYKYQDAVIVVFLLPLFSPPPLSSLHQARIVSPALLPSR